MKEQNQLLGVWVCSQGGKAQVYQTKKAGRHFYTRCDCCGLMQGTGAALQQRIFDEAEFLPGVNFAIPSNVVQNGRPVLDVGRVDPPALDSPSVGDFDPSEPVEGGGDGEEVEKAHSAVPGFLVPLTVFLAAAGLAWWTN